MPSAPSQRLAVVVPFGGAERVARQPGARRKPPQRAPGWMRPVVGRGWTSLVGVGRRPGFGPGMRCASELGGSEKIQTICGA